LTGTDPSKAAVADLARAHGEPLFKAGFRAASEHFQVTEEPGFEPSGEGEHDYLWIEKVDTNTDWVARQLARAAGVRPVDVGYAGRKDRYAVARQWFSVRTVGRDVDWTNLDVEGVRVLAATRHDRKLRRGAHRGNRFRIVLVDVTPVPFAALVARYERIRRLGIPNYFGSQRFGRDNLGLARSLFAGRRLRRNEQSLALSAARSELFNRILDHRVRDGSWDRLTPGELANLDGTNSVFQVDAVDDELERRVRRHDVHPTASLWGSLATRRVTGPAAALEATAVEASAELRAGLENAGLDTGQRPCRVVPRELTVLVRPGELTVSFSLPSGAFATSVLREFGELRDYSNTQLLSSRT
jgi:tRNA pseudouridine13 synthase